MNRKELIVAGIFLFGIMLVSQLLAGWLITSKPNTLSKFGVPTERIAKDLDGRAVSLMLNQVWPFDASQNIEVQIIGKKQVDEFVIVVIDVKALAPVQQAETPKEQFSTTTTSKDVPKTPPKLPSKLRLVGKMKLTYEFVDNEWYLMGTENLSLRAIPID